MIIITIIIIPHNMYNGFFVCLPWHAEILLLFSILCWERKIDRTSEREGEQNKHSESGANSHTYTTDAEKCAELSEVTPITKKWNVFVASERERKKGLI